MFLESFFQPTKLCILWPVHTFLGPATKSDKLWPGKILSTLGWKVLGGSTKNEYCALSRFKIHPGQYLRLTLDISAILRFCLG